VGVDFAVVRGNVTGDVKLLAQFMGATDAVGQIIEGEIVVAHSQAVAWLAGVHSVGAVSKGVFHIADGARRRKEIWRHEADYPLKNGGIISASRGGISRCWGRTG